MGPAQCGQAGPSQHSLGEQDVQLLHLLGSLMCGQQIQWTAKLFCNLAHVEDVLHSYMWACS